MSADPDKLLSNIQSLYKTVGAEPGKCRGCGAPIWWIVSKNGKRSPFTAEALNHFADCPTADRFRKKT